jgi:hypothetical protein
MTEEERIECYADCVRHIVDHMREGGSYRVLIYERFGFGPEAYTPIYLAGGMTLSNACNQLADFTPDEGSSDGE